MDRKPITIRYILSNVSCYVCIWYSFQTYVEPEEITETTVGFRKKVVIRSTTRDFIVPERSKKGNLFQIMHLQVSWSLAQHSFKTSKAVIGYVFIQKSLIQTKHY